MKKVKTAVWVLIIAFVIVLIYQNQEFFLSKQSLNLNLIFAQYKTPEMAIVYFSGIFFLAGLILGFYFLAARGLKTKKKTKTLNAQLTEQSEKITTLESELTAIKGTPVTEEIPHTEPDAKTVVINPDDKPQVSEIKS